jgi:hypothetical protein
LIGEALNFIGALVMALDIFFRRAEESREVNLSRLTSLAKAKGITSTVYKQKNVASDEFARSVVRSRSLWIAYGGVFLLAAGFLCLAIYHVLEIRQTGSAQTQQVYGNGVSPVLKATIFRNSETNSAMEEF